MHKLFGRIEIRLFYVAVSVLLGIFCVFLCVHGETGTDSIYTNGDTDYKVFIRDNADLLSEGEEKQLTEIMKQLTAYTSVCLVTTDKNDIGSSKDFARNCYDTIVGSGNGTIFLIDMDNRELLLYTNGPVKDIITSAKSDTIADNVYRYASKGRYYVCCQEVFSEEYALLSGKKIKQPMKYFSNAFLAVILGLLFNYFVVKLFSSSRKPQDTELLGGLFMEQNYEYKRTIKTYQSKKYQPITSGGGGDSFGGDSFGGGSSDGGSSGGHDF